MDGAAHPLCDRRLIRLLLGLAILTGWLVIGSYRLSLASLRLQGDGQAYIVQSGDSLTRISANFYGEATHWSEIFEATNAKAREDNSFATIANPRLIYPGQKLWIPALPLADQMAATTQPPATPTQLPPAAGSPITSEPMAAAATQTPANPFLAAVRQLVGESDQAGSLASAQSQSQLALEHLGFLQEALAQSDLTLARRHAEHIVNILEGEDGVLFGDNDRDGQTQNPGDGVGVRVYLADAQTVLDVLGETTVGGEAGASISPLRAATMSSQELMQAAAEKAFQVFAADSVGETAAIAAELEGLVNELEASITNVITSSSELLTTRITSPAAETEILLPLLELLAEDGGVLTSAQSQSQLALEHLGFLQEALAQSDLTLARRHAEHIVNILEGKDGVLFGDNDRDGQTQNPGDGVGVRAYLADAQTQAQTALDGLDEAALDTATGASVQRFVASTARGQKLTQEAAEKTLQIFAADTVRATRAIAVELELLLNDLQGAITTTFTTGDQLFQK